MEGVGCYAMMGTMADRAVLHIGAPKSGTTYLQSVLWNSKDRLVAGDVLLPGGRRFSHTRAANAICAPVPAKRRPDGPRATWERLLQEIHAWHGAAVLSDEWLVRANAEQAARAVEEIGAPVDVVFTARDFLRQVPAAWQEELKLGNAVDLGEFVETLDQPGKWSWSTLDPAEVLTAWADVLPPERLHVVTVPPSGAAPDLLWRRFAEASGFDPALGDLDVSDANESLGVEAARLLELLGPELRSSLEVESAHWTVPYRWIRRYLAHELLVPVSGSRIGLDEAMSARIRLRTDSSVRRVHESHWNVIGDLSDLSAATVGPSDRLPTSVSEGELLAVALGLVPALLAEVRKQTERAERAEQPPG